MANTFAPFGFAQIGVQDGIAPTFGNSTALVSRLNATPIYRGDPVVRLATGYIAQATPGTTQIHGIFWGCKRLSVVRGEPTWSKQWTGSDALNDAEAFIDSVSSATFIVQANGQLLLSHVGMNANFALGTGNLASGISGASLDVSTIATTTTLPLRILSLWQASTPPTGAPGQNGTDQTSPFGFAVVTFNNQDFKSLTGI